MKQNFLSKQNNYSLEVIFAQILVLMSPVVVDYIYKPKQFFIDFCIAIYLVKYFSEDKNIKSSTESLLAKIPNK